jgi:hypothetical protein
VKEEQQAGITGNELETLRLFVRTEKQTMTVKLLTLCPLAFLFILKNSEQRFVF